MAAITFVKWTAEGLPDGLTINEDTGVISGTPTVEMGSYSVYVTVETNYGADSKYITINVEAPEGWEPIIEPDQIITIFADTAMTYEIKGTNVKKTA